MSEKKIDEIECPMCCSNRVRHEVEYSLTGGDAEDAYFECEQCENQWSDFKLSEQLLKGK
jgi:transposase-like protein